MKEELMKNVFLKTEVHLMAPVENYDHFKCSRLKTINSLPLPGKLI